MRAHRLLAENVAALLKKRGYTQAELARWCLKSKPWVSDFLNHGTGWKIADLDRISDFLGVPLFQLFQPGVSERSERRSGGERRHEGERRVTQHERMARHLDMALRPLSTKGDHVSALRTLAIEFEARVSRLVSQAHARGQAAAAAPPLPAARRRRRAASGPDDSET